MDRGFKRCCQFKKEGLKVKVKRSLRRNHEDMKNWFINGLCKHKQHNIPTLRHIKHKFWDAIRLCKMCALAFTLSLGLQKKCSRKEMTHQRPSQSIVRRGSRQGGGVNLLLSCWEPRRSGGNSWGGTAGPSGGIKHPQSHQIPLLSGAARGHEETWEFAFQLWD